MCSKEYMKVVIEEKRAFWADFDEVVILAMIIWVVIENMREEEGHYDNSRNDTAA